MAEPARLLDLAEAISDGRPIDWAEAESSADSEDAREIVRQLRLLAGVAEVHRVPDAAEPTPAPSSWGALTIVESLGAGSFGSVYRAHDSRLGRDVALKLLHKDRSDTGNSIIEEGRLLARIRHAHVVSVYGADRIDGRVGVWTELVAGRTLEQILATDGPFGAREAAVIGIDLCGALAAVHAEGVVHRDVKPSNVMREDGGRIVLMDFGAGIDRVDPSVVKVAGTPACMAPELLAGAPASVSSDLYALGVLLFRLVTGRYPVSGRTFTDIQDAHARGERLRLRDLRPELPQAFIDVVERATSVNIESRFGSAGEMQAALGACILGPATPGAKWRPLNMILAAVITVGIGTAVASPFLVRREPAPEATAPVITGVRALGIRPLTDASSAEGGTYFAAGLSDVLLSTLGGIRSLRVVSLSGDGAWQSRAAQMNVDGVLEGSVHRSGNRVRVSARVVHLASGAILWGRTYEAGTGEMFTLQGKIAADLAQDINLSVAAPTPIGAQRTYRVSATAEDAYLHGRYLLDSLTVPNLKQARVLLEGAVKEEPLYAPAHATLALTYMALGNVGALAPDDVRRLAPVAAATAYTQDPTLPDAALALADVRFRLEWDWSAADEAYRHAIALNPNSVAARSRYARFLAAAGRASDGLVQAQEAYRIDPLSTDIHGVVGIMLYYARRYDDAIRHFESRAGAPSDRTRVGLARALAEAGRYAEAIGHLSAVVRSSGDDPSMRAELARTYAAAGEVTRARGMLDALTQRRDRAADYVAPQDLAYVHIALGDHDAGLTLLEEAVREQASRLLWLAVDPRVDPVRSNPRFKAVLERLGLKSS